MAEENINESQEEETTPEAKNPLEMSDEEILNMSPEEFDSPDAGNEQASSETEDTDEPDEEEESTDDEEEESKESSNESSVEQDKFSDSKDEDTSDDGETSDAKKEEGLEKNTQIDYKAEYEKLLAPFNAAGQEIKVQSVDEAIRLMQMGVGFNKKTAAMKDLRRKIQPLEEHKLLTEENISLFIDLVAKKDQNALKKLINDFGVDPIDIDTDDSSEYKPNTYTADENRLELDDVLDSLRDSPHYTNILDIVGNKWDEKSKQAVAAKPNIMNDLESHITSGVYEKVNAEMQRQRALGYLQGMSDLEAYNTVGAKMAEAGAFQEQQTAPLEAQNQNQTQQNVAPTNKTNPELNSKRKAAATTKSMPSSQNPPQKNPLGMSDEEFLKAGF